MQVEKRRIILFIALAIVASILWHRWGEMFPAEATPTNVVSSLAATLPQASNETIPNAATQNEVSTTNPSEQQLPPISVKTDVFDIKINPVGGSIIYASLLKYPVSQSEKTPVVMMTTAPGATYLANTAFLPSQGKSTSNLIYTSALSSYQLNEHDNALQITLTAKDNKGVVFTKQYLFNRSSYDIKMVDTIHNASQSPWVGIFNASLTRENNPPEKKGIFHIASFFGASYSTEQDAYHKIDFKKMIKAPTNVVTQGGWIAMQQHYFLSAFVPPQKEQNRIFTTVSPDGLYTIASDSSQYVVNPGKIVLASTNLYVGPEIPSNLEALAPHLDLTIDYGFLWFISVIIFWLMQKIYSIVGNWGWSIVLVTVLIKLLFYKLSATSYRSMAKLRNLQPKIKALQERYADDRQKLTQATMELYRKEKANPLTGCLPIVIQIPVFIALYWVLVESVELRQAPFIFWITDLSSKDPYYVLPILNGLMMFVQQKLSPPPADPAQAKMMMLMPVFLTLVFMNFPAGLVLYWLVNSVCSILQQWYIMKTVEKHLAKAKHSHKNKK